MLKNSTKYRAPKSFRRGRSAAVAAGMGVALAVGGAGTAFAAEAQAGSGLLSSGTANSLAAATKAQADMQKRAADASAADRSQRVATAVKAASVVKKASGAWTKPISGGYALSAGFAQNGGMWSNKHSGQDFAVPTGTKVQSVHGGTVVQAGWGGAYGNNIVIKHADRTYSQYAHLSTIQVRVGQQVATGQQIARSGNTGNSTGPHLHFEIRTTPNYGSAVNPMAFLRSHGVGV